ncbi:MAG: MFS transporter [Opitutaceae bacterium]|nr:MFS transporter [Opitutaceae bacterium]
MPPSVSSEHPAPAADTLSQREKIVFSVGGGLQQFGNTAPQYLANPIFNLALGMNPVHIGIVLAIARLWDAVSDPLVGNWSDNARTRWGRRRPFMVVGAILTGVSFAAMWWLPRDASQTFYFGYFLFTILSFFTGMTLFTVPWTALGIASAPGYGERTKLFAYVGVTHKIVGFTTGWLYPLCQLAAFQTVLDGAHIVGCVCGTLIIVICLIPALTLKEPPDTTAMQRQKPEPFLHAMKAVMSNRVLLIFSLACLVTMTSLYTVSSLGLYINIYHVFGGDKLAAATMMGIWGTLFNLLAMLSIPMMLWLSNRVGKHRAIMLSLGMVSISAVLKWVLYTPSLPYLQLATALLHAPGLAAYLILVNSMTADIVDYDELLTGRRREALIAAANGWITKMGISLSFIFAGLVLSVTGFDATLGNNQPAGTVLSMRLLFCAIPAFGTLTALLILSRYPLTRQRVEQIQAMLVRNRSAG